MKFVALVSGGKDSVYNIAKCLAYGHELVALANLYPPLGGPEELDSFMFQSAGSTAIEALAECLDVPLFRSPMSGQSKNRRLHYTETEGDEIEDLLQLIQKVLIDIPDVEAVASGAVLSTYQRTRVEHVCDRLHLQSLAFLWQYDQATLLQEMIDYGLTAILVKVSSAGLKPHRDLGKTLQEMLPCFAKLHHEFDFHVAGEGGEYESLTLDAPFFKRRIVLDKTEIIVHSDDPFAPVGLLRIVACHTQGKEEEEKAQISPTITTTTKIPSQRLLLTGQKKGDDEEEEEERGKETFRVPPFFCLPHFNRQGRQLFISGYSAGSSRCTSYTHDDVETETQMSLRILQQVLEEEGLTLEDVVFVHLYLRSMQDFQAVNKVYCQAPFHPNYPPSRSCIEVKDLSCAIVLSAFALEGSGKAMSVSESREDRQVLHVKSLSAWAPLCIGPYSQANVLTQGHVALLAGQIALEPSSMRLVSGGGGFEAECFQALSNAQAVLQSVKSSLYNTVMMVVYLHTEKDWPDIDRWRAMASGIAKQSAPKKFADLREYASSSSSSSEEEEEEEEEEEVKQLLSQAPILFVGVSNLPRNAAVELEIMALSTVLTRQLEVRSHRCSSRGSLPQRSERISALPLPFQPLLERRRECTGGRSYTVDWESTYLPYVFSLMSLSLSVSLQGETDKPLLLQYSDFLSTLGLCLAQHLQQGLCSRAELTCRQVSTLRVFYLPHVIEEASLREIFMATVFPESSVAKTFVPLSRLQQQGQQGRQGQEPPSSITILKIQAIAMDLEKLRTEAWVHQVPRVSI